VLCAVRLQPLAHFQTAPRPHDQSPCKNVLLGVRPTRGVRVLYFVGGVLGGCPNFLVIKFDDYPHQIYL